MLSHTHSACLLCAHGDKAALVACSARVCSLVRTLSERARTIWIPFNLCAHWNMNSQWEKERKIMLSTFSTRENYFCLFSCRRVNESSTKQTHTMNYDFVRRRRRRKRAATCGQQTTHSLVANEKVSPLLVWAKAKSFFYFSPSNKQAALSMFVWEKRSALSESDEHLSNLLLFPFALLAAEIQLEAQLNNLSQRPIVGWLLHLRSLSILFCAPKASKSLE